MADPAREKLIEAVAESDDALIEQYLDEGTLPEATIAQGAKAGFANARLAPVFVGSASKAIGIDRLLDFIVEEFPSPAERAPLTVIAKGGEEQERAVRPERAAHRLRVQDGLRPVRRTHHDVPGLQREGPPRHVRPQRHPGHRRADRPAVRAQGEGARERLRGAGGRHRRRREAAPHPHRRHVLHEGRPGAAPGGGAPRAAPRLRDLAEDQGRGGPARDRSRAPPRGGPDVPRRPQRRDPRDRDLRDGRGAPGRPDGAAEGEVRRRGRGEAREDRLPGDDPRQGEGARAAT